MPDGRRKGEGYSTNAKTQQCRRRWANMAHDKKEKQKAKLSEYRSIRSACLIRASKQDYENTTSVNARRAKLRIAAREILQKRKENGVPIVGYDVEMFIDNFLTRTYAREPVVPAPAALNRPADREQRIPNAPYILPPPQPNQGAPESAPRPPADQVQEPAILGSPVGSNNAVATELFNMTALQAIATQHAVRIAQVERLQQVQHSPAVTEKQIGQLWGRLGILQADIGNGLARIMTTEKRVADLERILHGLSVAVSEASGRGGNTTA